LPFGASVATTWLNLMTIGACALAAGMPAAAAATSALEPFSTSRLFISPLLNGSMRFFPAGLAAKTCRAGYSGGHQP
jgi:hypothetical protein